MPRLAAIMPPAEAVSCLVNLAVAVSLVCAVGLLVARACRHGSAPLRHGILVWTLVLILFSPAAVWLAQQNGLALVRVTVAGLPDAHGAAIADEPAPCVSDSAPAQSASSSAAGSAPPFVPAGRPSTMPSRSVSSGGPGALSSERSPVSVVSSKESLSAVGGSAVSVRGDSRAWAWWQVVGALAALLWAVGVVFGLLRLGWGCVALARFCRRLDPLPAPRQDSLARQAADALGLRGLPPVFLSRSVGVPVSIGLLKPAIVLPEPMARETDEDQLQAVLLHEMAHIARRDHWVGVGQRIASVLFWWNPLVHRVCDEISELREEICDNYVVLVQGEGQQLARILVDLAARAAIRPLWPSTVGVLQPKLAGLTGRVSRLLDGERNTAIRMNLRSKVLVLTCGLALLIGMASVGGLRLAYAQPALEVQHAAADPFAADQPAASSPGAPAAADPLAADQPAVPSPGAPAEAQPSALAADVSKTAAEVQGPSLIETLENWLSRPAKSKDDIRSLFVIDADGSNLRPLLSMPEYTACGSPEWSGDGKKIAFDAWRPSRGESNQEAHVFLAGAEGSSIQDLGPGAMPSWSPDGKQITFSQYRPLPAVCVMNADGSDRQLLDANGWGAEWSPRRNEIAYVINMAGGQDLCIYDVSSKVRRMLLGNEFRYIRQGFTWSPDGDHLCFKGFPAENKPQIAVVHREGQQKGFKVLLPSAAAPTITTSSPTISWGGSGNRVLVCARGETDRNPQLYLLDFAGNQAPKLLEGQDPGRDNFDMAWSPDGKKIVFTSRVGAAPPGRTKAEESPAAAAEPKAEATPGERPPAAAKPSAPATSLLDALSRALSGSEPAERPGPAGTGQITLHGIVTGPAAEKPGGKPAEFSVELERFGPRPNALPDGTTMTAGGSIVTVVRSEDSNSISISIETAKRHHEETKKLIAEKKYKFLSTFEDQNGGKQYVYRFTLPDGSQVNMNFSMRLENVASWDDYRRKEEEQQQQQQEKINKAIAAGNFRLINLDVIRVHLCRDVDTNEKFEVQRIPLSDGKEIALFTPAEAAEKPQTRPQTRRETSWQDHLQAIREGKRELLGLRTLKNYTYEMVLEDGSKTIFDYGGGEPLKKPDNKDE